MVPLSIFEAEALSAWIRSLPESRQQELADRFHQALLKLSAAGRGDETGVKAAVTKGADPNGEGKDGVTPLLYVLSDSRNKAGLRALLAAGADPNKPSANGTSPLVLATRAEDSEYLEIMLAGGGNPDLKNASHEPLIQVAARDERWKNLEILLVHGANINSVDGSGYSAIMNLTPLRRYERIFWLIEKGADVKIVARNGSTLALCIRDVPLDPNSPQVAWRQKVVDLLHRQGIEIPAKTR